MSDVKPYKGAKAKCLPVETDDMTAILDMTIEQSTTRLGRPCVYANDDAGLAEFTQKTVDFFKYVNEINQNADMERKLIPDIENWAVYLGITRNTLLNYEQRGVAWRDCIQFYKNAISAIKKQLAMTYKIPPMVYVFDATNNHGYVNSNEFKLTATQAPETATDALEREIMQRGLVWDEKTKEYKPEE